MKKIDVKFVTYMSVVAALYVALTFAFAPLSYGAIQFRFSEILVLLVLYRKEYSIPLVIGCLIANLLSPIGLVDVIFGTLATLVSVCVMILIKNKFIASLVPAIVNGLVIGTELYFVFDLPFWLSVSQVFIGEFVVITIIGLAIFKSIEQNEHFKNILNLSGVLKDSTPQFKFLNKYSYLAFAVTVILTTLFFKLPIYQINHEDIVYKSLFDFVFKEQLYIWCLIILITPVFNLITITFLNKKINVILSLLLIIGSLIIFTLVLTKISTPIAWSILYYLVFLLLAFINIRHYREKAF